jgi:hypothetical protein
MKLWTFDDSMFSGRWHKWFAWHPVLIWHGEFSKIAWLETVWRRWDEEPHHFLEASCFIYRDTNCTPRGIGNLRAVK